MNPRSGPAVSLIAAVASNRVIGNRGSLPWRIPGDLARFKRLTMGRPVVMGHSTFRSLGKPLAGRINVVMTRDLSLRISGCAVVHSREEALLAAEREAPGEAFVIGGASVYALFLPVATRLYITWIDAEVPGDTLFPEIAWSEWRVVNETPGKAASPGQDILPHRFVDYVRSEK